MAQGLEADRMISAIEAALYDNGRIISSIETHILPFAKDPAAFDIAARQIRDVRDRSTTLKDCLELVRRVAKHELAVTAFLSFLEAGCV